MCETSKHKDDTCILPDREATLEAYALGRLPQAEEEKIAAHIFDCNLCFRELQFLQDLRQTVPRLAGPLASVTPLPWYKGIMPMGRTGWAVAAAVLLAVGLYGSMRLAAPRFYEPAKLTRSDREGLNLASREPGTAPPQKFALAAQALLAAEGKRLGLWPYFDQIKTREAISQLRAAYEEDHDAFARDEYAYFLGKAFLMKAQPDSACAWFKRVLDSPARNYESETKQVQQAAGCQKQP